MAINRGNPIKTMVEGQTYSDNGIRKFARIWADNLFLMPVDKFKQDSGSYLLDAWCELPYGPRDREAVIRWMAQDEELRWKLHCFDVLYLMPRVVEWDCGKRLSYIYSLEQDICRQATSYVICSDRDMASRAEWLLSHDPREDKRYG